MTSTAVKGVGNVMNDLTAGMTGQTAQNKAGNISFQSVLNSQTEKGTSPQTPEPHKADSEKTAEAKEPVQSGDTDKVKEADPKEEAGNSVDQTDTAEETVDLEMLTKAMEVLGTAATELITQIADTLGISDTRVQEMLQQMGMKAVDLLDAENLSAFLLKAFGAEDSFSLLTDEGMYADYKQLMSELDSLMQQESGPDGMKLADTYAFAVQNVEEAGAEIVQMPADMEQKPLEAVIQVTVEEETQDPMVEEVLPGAQEDVAGNAEQAGHTQERQTQGREHSEHEGGREGSSFMQSLQQLDPNLQLGQQTEVSGGFDVDAQDIMRQIMDYMRFQVKPDMSNVEMQLHPENLGTLQIHVASKGGIVTANFVTQSEAVKAALESQMVQLRESFEQQGVKVEAVEVTVQTHEFEQNLEQGRERGQGQQTAKGQRTRRLKLDGGLAGMEEMEAIDEEDRLTAQMMAANGNTVDFTA